MTNEKLYSLMVEFVRDFAQLEKDNYEIAETAEALIIDPASWLVKYGNVSLHPAVALMEKAASVMVDCVAKMSAKSGNEKTVAAAAKRIYKSAAASANASCHGTFEDSGYFNLCDGFRIVRTVKEFPALPKLPENTPRLNISALMEKTINDGRKVEIVPPSIAEVKAFLAAEKERIKGVKNANPKPYIFKDANEQPLIGFNPQFVIDALEVLPGAKWYGINDLSPVYIVSEDGDSLLLPVTIRNTAAGTAKDELIESWEALRANYFPQLAATEAAKFPQTNTTEAKAAEAEAQPTTEAEEKAAAVKASAEAPAEETITDAVEEAAERLKTPRNVTERLKADHYINDAEKAAEAAEDAQRQDAAPAPAEAEARAEAATEEAPAYNSIITTQKPQEGIRNAFKDNYIVNTSRTQGRRQIDAKKAMLWIDARAAGRKPRKASPSPAEEAGRSICGEAGRKAAGAGGGGSGRRAPAQEKRQRQSRHRLTVTAFGSLVGWGKADTRQQKAVQACSASSAKNASVLRLLQNLKSFA